MALTDEQTEHLIIEVERNTVLYNLADKRYKDTRLKNDIWEEIADKVGIESGQIASKKFVNIKDAYVAYLRKLHLNRSGQGLAGKFRKYKWSDQLQFLNAYVTTRRSTGNLNVTSDDECETLLNAIVDGSEGCDDEQPVPFEDMKDDVTATPISMKVPLSPGHTSGKRKRTKTEDVNAAIIDYFATKKPVEKDALANFFESALQTVRTFPKSKQVKMKKLVSDALYEIEAEMAQCEE